MRLEMYNYQGSNTVVENRSWHKTEANHSWQTNHAISCPNMRFSTSRLQRRIHTQHWKSLYNESVLCLSSVECSEGHLRLWTLAKRVTWHAMVQSVQKANGFDVSARSARGPVGQVNGKVLDAWDPCIPVLDSPSQLQWSNDSFFFFLVSEWSCSAEGFTQLKTNFWEKCSEQKNTCTTTCHFLKPEKLRGYSLHPEKWTTEKHLVRSKSITTSTQAHCMPTILLKSSTITFRAFHAGKWIAKGYAHLTRETFHKSNWSPWAYQKTVQRNRQRFFRFVLEPSIVTTTVF